MIWLIAFLKSCIVIALVLCIALFFSANRRSINVRKSITAFLLQCFFAVLVLKTPVGQWVFNLLAAFIDLLNASVDQSICLLFGNFAYHSELWGAIYFVKVVPMLIFLGAFFTLLFHWGIMQRIANFLVLLLHPLLPASAVEIICALLNAFLGQVETPLLMKHYMKAMKPSEMLVFMVSGMSLLNIALIVIYASLGVPLLHLLAAALMGIPGSILIAKLLLPDEQEREHRPVTYLPYESFYTSGWDAVHHGTLDGVKIATGTVGMLITCMSMIALMNYLFLLILGITLDQLFAYLFCPIAFLLDIPSRELLDAGTLLGQKLVVNEYIAYMSMLKGSFSDRSLIILTYALAGFANFTSIGVQVGTVAAFVPEQRKMVASLAMKALLGASLVNFINAAIAVVLN